MALTLYHVVTDITQHCRLFIFFNISYPFGPALEFTKAIVSKSLRGWHDKTKHSHMEEIKKWDPEQR